MSKNKQRPRKSTRGKKHSKKNVWFKRLLITIVLERIIGIIDIETIKSLWELLF